MTTFSPTEYSCHFHPSLVCLDCSFMLPFGAVVYEVDGNVPCIPVQLGSLTHNLGLDFIFFLHKAPGLISN